jgi:hypothetical protein
MIYEFINPSDPYTFEAGSLETAALASFFIGSAYGARGKDGSTVPIFLLGGAEEWFKESFNEDIQTGYNRLKADVAEALDSFVYGDFGDKERYDIALEAITSPEKKAEFISKWNNQRTSMNDIITIAHARATAIRQSIANENGENK